MLCIVYYDAIKYCVILNNITSYDITILAYFLPYGPILYHIKRYGIVICHTILYVSYDTISYPTISNDKILNCITW